MVSHASLFSQMLLLIDRHGFEREVRRLDAERHSKGFSESAKKSGVKPPCALAPSFVVVT